MKKKILILPLAALTICGAIYGATATNSINKIDATSNIASDWVLQNGSGFGATDITNGVRIGNIPGPYAQMYNKNKVKLDGLSFTFNNVVGANCKTLGFYFNKEIAKAPSNFSKHVFTLWHAPYSNTQARLSCTLDHDYNATPTCYTTSAFAEAGFGVAASMVMNNNKSTNDGINVKFNKIDTSTWTVTFKELYSQTIWTNNANYDSTEKSCMVYLKDSDVSTYLDGSGKAYLNVFGMDASATSAYAEVTNLVETSTKVTKAELEAEVALITDDMINSFINMPSLVESLNTKKATAIEFLKTAPESGDASEYLPVYSFLNEWSDRYTSYGYTTASSKIESGMPFTSYSGSCGVNESTRKEFQYNPVANWGQRAYYNNSIDATNFTIKYNLGLLPVYGVFPILINSEGAPGSYFDSDDRYFHLEAYKVESNKYFLVLGNTTSHNISIAEFGTEQYGNYTGRYVISESGDFRLQIKTDFKTNQTSISINKGLIELTLKDNSILFRGETPKDAILAKVAFGAFGGDIAGTRVRTIINSIVSNEDKEKYFDNGSNVELKFRYDSEDAGDFVSIKVDDEEVRAKGYRKPSGSVFYLTNAYLNYLSVGDHVVKLVCQNKTFEWNLHIVGLETLLPITKKASTTINSSSIRDINYPINSNGADVSKVKVYVDSKQLDTTNYSFVDYNTMFVLKGNYITSLEKGKHVITFTIEGSKNKSSCSFTIV